MTTNQKVNDPEPRTEATGEACTFCSDGDDGVITEESPEILLRTNMNLLEEILSRENLRMAHEVVLANEGCPGIDGMTVHELKDHLYAIWPELRAQLLEGRYRPKPVKRVEIPKKGGGVRMLGIPTVQD